MSDLGEELKKLIQMFKEIDLMPQSIQSSTRARKKALNLLEKQQEEIEELEQKYNELSYSAIEVVFSEYNDDVELLARKLLKQGQIKRKGDYYINPDYDEFNNIEKRKIGEDDE